MTLVRTIVFSLLGSVDAIGGAAFPGMIPPGLAKASAKAIFSTALAGHCAVSFRLELCRS